MIKHPILVVDDDPDVLETIRVLLGTAGYAVSVASSGREAIRLLNSSAVDLIITDVLMPNMDGFELIAALHKNFANIRVIAMSGGGQVSADTYLMMARGFNVDWLLKKPFSRDELLMAIKAVEARSSNSAASCEA